MTIFDLVSEGKDDGSRSAAKRSQSPEVGGRYSRDGRGGRGGRGRGELGGYSPATTAVPPLARRPGRGPGPGPPPPAGAAVCDQPILDSPWHYDGAPGTYTVSGQPTGLPTFGTPRERLPCRHQDHRGAGGNNTTAASTGLYNVDNAIVYFEPGIHEIENGMYTGHESAYVGGYTQEPEKQFSMG